MEKLEKQIQEDDVLAAILKVKPTADMPRSKAKLPKRRTAKPELKPTK
jgi:hypothetical protein